MIVGIPREIKDNEHTNVTLPYAVAIASTGGVNVYPGSVTNAPVAEAHGLEHVALSSVIDGTAD